MLAAGPAIASSLSSLSPVEPAAESSGGAANNINRMASNSSNADGVFTEDVLYKQQINLPFQIGCFSSTTGNGGNDAGFDSIVVQLSLVGKRKTIQAKLLRDEDPFFLWFCSINEDEFYRLKREQNLLVSFCQFPYKIIELLELTQQRRQLHEPTGTSPVLLFPSSSTKYSVKIEQSVDGEGERGLNFSIIEETSFRTASLFSLLFRAPSHEVLRRHVTLVVKGVLEERSKISNEIATLRNSLKFHADAEEERNKSLTKKYNEKCREFNELMGDADEYNKKICELKLLVKQLREECEYLKVENSSIIDDKGETMEKYARLQQEYHQIQQQSSHLGSSVGEKEEEIAKANEIIRKLQSELKAAKSELRVLNGAHSVCDEREKSAEEMAKRLGEEIKQKQVEIDLLNQQCSSNIKLQERLTQLQSENEDQSKNGRLSAFKTSVATQTGRTLSTLNSNYKDSSKIHSVVVIPKIPEMPDNLKGSFLFDHHTKLSANNKENDDAVNGAQSAKEFPTSRHVIL